MGEQMGACIFQVTILRYKVQIPRKFAFFHRKIITMSKLFVYGVDPACPRETLEGEFGRCGEVTDVYNTEKGYAFVTMADDDGADQAIRALNGKMVDGKEIKVDNARGGGGGYGGGDRYGGGGGGYGGGRGGSRGCYNCHQDGHIARECPEARQ